jgi:hypothetical protein
MGAKISTPGPHIYEIEGSSELKGFSYDIIPDPIEAGTFILLALATKGEILVKNINIEYLTLFFKKIKNFGANIEFPDANSAKVLFSPKIRILLQIIVILPFVIFFDLKLTDLRINLLNSFLQINLISIIFTVFCILVLVNGTNFIDGLKN